MTRPASFSGARLTGPAHVGALAGVQSVMINQAAFSTEGFISNSADVGQLPGPKLPHKRTGGPDRSSRGRSKSPFTPISFQENVRGPQRGNSRRKV